ncbi:hypothetical protein BO94DRAFT_589380 [Aspergillus sclerotioniger CBS 115572]|uniref:Uncharacterized protein n=1 Tax=Aspergillus sclerotioniger CBS 115572 TaxID=1450535 RepID=A0A317VHK2_9EURO|nr:hypothetical protein BO94DRAFT_589380 [Aspergillus sclerotioniger CBS 115572]PWY73846.1 hypothetical protein BO94DRAFT_589380 [Aspergillus sclerotioniger CBS 115572]
MTPCATALLSLLTALIGILYPLSSPGLLLYREPELAPFPNYTLSYLDDPIFSPLASHIANNPYPWRDKRPFREANSALLLGAVEALLKAGAIEDDDASDILVTPEEKPSEANLSLSGQASQWLSCIANNLLLAYESATRRITLVVSCIANNLLLAYESATRRIILVVSCMCLAFTLIIADQKRPEISENDVYEHECDAQDPVVYTIRLVEEKEVQSDAALEEETLITQDSFFNYNGDQVREDILRLLGTVKEEASWLTDRIKLLSLRLSIHSELLEGQILEEKQRSSIALPPKRARMVGTIWEVFQEQVTSQFEEQLLLLDEATAQIQQACENLPDPRRYEGFCDEFESELQHTVDRINDLRERVVGARQPYANSQTPLATTGGSASSHWEPEDMDEDLSYGREGAQSRFGFREPCLSPIMEEGYNIEEYEPSSPL